MSSASFSEKELSRAFLLGSCGVSAGSDFQDLGGGYAASDVCANAHTEGGGVAAALDLTIGHLSTDQLSIHQSDSIVNNFDFDDSIPFVTPFNTFSSSPLYIPMCRANTLLPVSGWYNVAGREYKECPIVAKIQRFDSGGYEVTTSWIDLERLGRYMDCAWIDADKVRVTAKREPREQNENDMARSMQRAKKNVRLKVKNMDCDRLLTLTKRESNPLHFWHFDEWAAAWKRFNRLLSKAGVRLNYVAVLEMHEKGNFHLHAAIRGKVNVKTLRRCWLICCGGKGDERGAASLGNVDVSYKPNITGHRRRSGIARYISKYITKQADRVCFNRKRYWSTKTALPPVERYVLSADSVRGALVELSQLLGLDVSKLLDKKHVFIFPNESGAWFSYSDNLLDASPPF